MPSLTKAYNHLQQGELHEASAILQAFLDQNPGDSQACYLLGITVLEQGDEESAMDRFKETINLAPEATPAHYNLGILYYNRGDFRGAQSAYARAAELAPEDMDIRFNLALTYKQLGQLTQAKELFAHILAITPDDTDTLYNLANTEQQLHNSQQAILLLETLLQYEPERLSALNNLGYLYHKEGENKKAIPVYQSLIKNNHNVMAAKHLLASLTGITTAQAPAAYVKDVFDQFADHFDASLQQKLGYNTPTLLRQLLRTVQPQAQFKHGLDLGCGTGLSGETFTDCTTILTGIDLSPKMLDQAREKNLYTELHESDLVPFIQSAEAAYDLYIAADVFVYIGDLRPIFTSIARQENLKTFIFSTEHAAQNYILKPTGRYGHSTSYIHDLAKECNFTILTHESAPIRKEGSAWINGELYILSSL